MSKIVVELKIRNDYGDRFTIDIVSDYPIQDVRYLINELIDEIEYQQKQSLAIDSLKR